VWARDWRNRRLSGARAGTGTRKVRWIAIDTAHAHSIRVFEAVKAVKKSMPEVQLMRQYRTYEQRRTD